jgi:hypothetical protein
MSTTTCPACRALTDVPVRTRDGTVTCRTCGYEFVPTVVDPTPATDTPPASLQPQRQFAVTPFTAPPGRLSPRLVVPLVVGVVLALVLGVAAAILRSFFWILIVFPMLHGILVGVCIGGAARLAKARSHGALLLVAAGCGLLTYFIVHYLFYLGFLATPNAPQVGFWAYMDLRATEGVRLGRAAGGGAGGGIGYTGSIIYWIVEAVVTILGAIGAALACVGSPFCVGCNRWKKSRQLGPYAVEPQYAVPAVGAGVPAGLVVPADGKKSVTVQLYTCPECGADGPVEAKATGTLQDGKNTTNWNAFVTYPGEALETFEEVDRTLHDLGLAGKKK